MQTIVRQWYGVTLFSDGTLYVDPDAVLARASEGLLDLYAPSLETLIRRLLRKRRFKGFKRLVIHTPALN